MKEYELHVPEDLAGGRLDTVLAALLPSWSRSFWKIRIAAGDVLVDGAPAAAHRKVHTGQTLLVRAEERVVPHTRGQDISVPIVFEDEWLVVVNKPRGLTVHPCAAQPEGTLVNALIARYGTLAPTADELRPGIVHRLDRVTSGLLVVARDASTH
ncbi:RNA pseudouridine synthase, partial [bacterium]|nr:RNA pseudouridine synthase [candidate division CSSED10-310 bacterium]